MEVLARVRHSAIWAVIAVMMLSLFGWWYLRGGGEGWLAVAMAPQATGSRSQTNLAQAAEKMFWQTLHDGRYEDVPETIELLSKAFKEHPYDPHIARRLGFMHGWNVLERNRLETIPATIADSAKLSQYYYDVSYRLDPDDDRMLGAKAVLRMLNGLIDKDEKMMREGYFLGQEAIRKFPEFNYFTISVALSTLPHTDPRFKEAVAMQWKLLEACDSWNDLKINLNRDEYAKRFSGHKRVCWDSWIAPHNMKGTLLHMGDILVKNGDWQTAIDIYKRIRAIPDYENWPMKAFLEERIRNAQANVEPFRIDYTERMGEKVTRPAMLLHTGYFCASCHQAKGSASTFKRFDASKVTELSK